MTSSSEIKRGVNGLWSVHVYFGPFKYTHGPYRFHFVARFVAWLEDGQH